jgi:antitoxin MazE
MRSTLRKIGNSRGVLIPASFLTACEIEGDIEMHLEGSRIVIEPVSAPRAGWFENFQPDHDEDAWKEMEETDKETEEWEW